MPNQAAAKSVFFFDAADLHIPVLCQMQEKILPPAFLKLFFLLVLPEQIVHVGFAQRFLTVRFGWFRLYSCFLIKCTKPFFQRRLGKLPIYRTCLDMMLAVADNKTVTSQLDFQSVIAQYMVQLLPCLSLFNLLTALPPDPSYQALDTRHFLHIDFFIAAPAALHLLQTVLFFKLPALPP